MSRQVTIPVVLSAVLLGTMALSPSAFAGDVKAGKKVYNKCKACHEISKPKNKVGPHLVDIIGRKAAAVDGYKYSDAMQEKGAEGLIWNDETLTAYLADPKAYVPKTKMVFPGLKKPEQIVDVIAYLKDKAED
tara:strand:- start:890 stop:1288 length:399 start_codon:yes stop_codon:yes gene_type:complete